MAVKTPRPGPRRIETGSAWLSGLIVATLSGGVAVLSASVLSAVFVAFGITVALALALGFLP
ncbi:hypothetical protein [Nocardia sp. NPDC005366]|uniref:hypothetical protein n=1 Tax=Nocardia sp. NPDC005366 TaxID=3156878 RepID=UPI0033AD808A